MTIRSIITIAVEDGPAKTTTGDIARLLNSSHHNTRILHAEELQDDSVRHLRHVYGNLYASHADNTNPVDLPMTQTEARERMDRDGYVETLISVSQGNYRAALIAEANGLDYSLAELCHDHSFDFGLPYEYTVQIVGVENLADTNMCNLLVTYSTDISTQLDDDED